MAMFFQGDEVEVCSKEEGFLGSYYQAKILSPFNNNTLYRVQYKNLVNKEDQTRPLVEIVSAIVEIRFEELKMSKLKSKEKVDDGDRSSLELLNGVETSTSSENEKLHKLTQMVLSKFVARLVTKMNNKMMIEKEGLKSCHEAGVEEGKWDYLIGKQKKQKTRGNRKKKQKINDQRKRQDPEKVMEMGLEPPPDMPQVFKDCIQDFGGSEIKLIIQKFVQVSDLRSQQNRLSMSLKQIRSPFLNEDEERMLNAKRQIALTLVEPCLSVLTF